MVRVITVRTGPLTLRPHLAEARPSGARSLELPVNSLRTALARLASIPVLVVAGCSPDAALDARALTTISQALIEPVPAGVIGGYGTPRVIPAGIQPRQQTVRLTPDGNRILFITPHPLVPEDENEVDDLYITDYRTGVSSLVTTSLAGGRAANTWLCRIGGWPRPQGTIRVVVVVRRSSDAGHRRAATLTGCCLSLRSSPRWWCRP